jgi:hypothetical protein
MTFIARLIKLVAGVVVVVLVAGIILHVAHANGGNGIVSSIYDVDTWLATPFANVFHPSDPDVRIAVNWGLAALVYGLVGWIVAAVLLRASVAGRGAWRRRRGMTTA